LDHKRRNFVAYATKFRQQARAGFTGDELRSANSDATVSLPEDKAMKVIRQPVVQPKKAKKPL
jgi:hypothetical protein